MFTSPKRARYCNRGDSGFIKVVSLYDLEASVLSSLSKKKTKGYEQAKAILASRVNTRN